MRMIRMDRSNCSCTVELIAMDRDVNVKHGCMTVVMNLSLEGRIIQELVGESGDV